MELEVAHFIWSVLVQHRGLRGALAAVGGRAVSAARFGGIQSRRGPAAPEDGGGFRGWLPKSDIAYQHDIKKKQQNAIFQFKGDQRSKEKEVEDQKLRLQVLEREERQLQDRIRNLNENIDQRAYTLEKTSAKLDGTLRENDQVRGAVNALEYQVQEFVRSNGQATELQKRLFRQKDQEVIKN